LVGAEGREALAEVARSVGRRETNRSRKSGEIEMKEKVVRMVRKRYIFLIAFYTSTHSRYAFHV
jgi:hypothetical protein